MEDYRNAPAGQCPADSRDIVLTTYYLAVKGVYYLLPCGRFVWTIHRSNQPEVSPGVIPFGLRMRGRWSRVVPREE